MNVQNILTFLTEIKSNNNREWFAEHKAWYEQVKSDFEQISNSLIAEIAQFDADIKNVQAKDCLFRIYRDTRFHDKTPYKTHMGVFIASQGGRKSQRGGYYFHLDPEYCFLASGVWCPEPAMLKELRKTVYENITEFKEIINNKEFATYFKSFYEDGMLKTVPRGYPKDFPDAYYLKLKHYMVSYDLSESFLQQKDFVQKAGEIFKTSYALNQFLNYTVDEVMGY